MKSLITIGEAMVELKTDLYGRLTHNFAGDTFNVAVYAKRWNPKLNVGFCSAIGRDLFSIQMRMLMAKEQINEKVLFTSETKNIGIYTISTDKQGERSFTYWRKGSAATSMVELLFENISVTDLLRADCLFFSGISLAILSEPDKDKLLILLKDLQIRGCKIAFAPNYRATMWESKEHAKHWFTKAYMLSDIVLPGLDEHQVLFDHNSVEEVEDFMFFSQVTEFVINAGESGCYGYNLGAKFHIKYTSAPIQVDSKAAGDSFAGTYLSCRLEGKSVSESIKVSNRVAREVVKHQGAIMDLYTYQNLFS
ncbi:sugar kinase [Catenovulum sp. 2E275]|uniref:sugar kinase n=1 Tax=Catenovulum sp. 2E275 TaxID=2980497 RepID=UPI0021D083AF|nr:sugar kinase [Catenovulum sp. 2E275]MCU4675637.1 sugar kinase [Catenovulum sp. 2E275]